MKLLRCLFFIIVLLTGAHCKKNSGLSSPGRLAAVTVVNVCTGDSSVVVNFSNDSIRSFISAYNVPLGSFYEYSVPSGKTPITVYQGGDSVHPMTSGIFDLQPQGIYSLFIAGQYSQNSQNAPDTLFTVDAIPYHSVADSSVGIRFVNLYKGGNPVSINQQGNANGSEVDQLGYKQTSPFKIYPATYANPDPSVGYVFEVRDATTSDLLTTVYYSNINRFQNITIVVNGYYSNAIDNQIGTLIVNNF